MGCAGASMAVIKIGEPITEEPKFFDHFPVTFIKNKDGILQDSPEVLKGRPFIITDLPLIKDQLESDVVISQDPIQYEPLRLSVNTSDEEGEDWPYTLTFELIYFFEMFEVTGATPYIQGYTFNNKYTEAHTFPGVGFGVQEWQGEYPPRPPGSPEPRCGAMFSGQAELIYRPEIWAEWLAFYEWEHTPFIDQSPIPPECSFAVPAWWVLNLTGPSGTQILKEEDSNGKTRISSPMVQCMQPGSLEFHQGGISAKFVSMYVWEVPK